MLTIQTVLSHFATNPESLARVRAEFDSEIESSRGLAFDSADYVTMLRQDPTLEACSDLTYLSYVIQEALRYNPPVVFTHSYLFEK